MGKSNHLFVNSDYACARADSIGVQGLCLISPQSSKINVLDLWAFDFESDPYMIA